MMMQQWNIYQLKVIRFEFTGYYWLFYWPLTQNVNMWVIHNADHNADALLVLFFISNQFSKFVNNWNFLGPKNEALGSSELIMYITISNSFLNSKLWELIGLINTATSSDSRFRSSDKMMYNQNGNTFPDAEQGSINFMYFKYFSLIIIINKEVWSLQTKIFHSVR